MYQSYDKEHADQEEFLRLKEQAKRRQAVNETKPVSDVAKNASSLRIAGDDSTTISFPGGPFLAD